MKSGTRLRRVLMVGLGLALGACATVPTGPPGPSAGASPAGPPSVATPPSAQERLGAAHREKAGTLEKAGRLREALDEWRIALTINPRDAAAAESRKNLESRIERGVAERLELGREALARGDNLEARRHLLGALALDSANKGAFETLQSQVKELRFVNHTVRPGETLAALADRYYGDRSRSEVIWETNQLPPNPRLTAGMVLRIPEIPGVPFVNPEARAATPRPEAASPDLSKAEGSREEFEVNPLLVEAKEALDKGEYAVALADVDKVLAGNAQSSEGADLKKAALYGLGKAQLTQRRFDESYQTLTSLAKLAPSYQDAPALLRQARQSLIQQHYSQGLRLFQEEKLEEAIAQWRTVLEYDPQHGSAKKNIEQADRLLKNLQERQQPKKP